MVKLTEEMIVARTRVSDMANVKKLNCWGAELTDVSVLRKLVNVEVLSLSVNCISTLADIQGCRNLQELYIRKNKISDLGELCYLTELTKLKNLWLEENPCVQHQGDLYRLSVIRNLPQLQKLDNVAIQPDELAEAMRRGVELVHPLDKGLSAPGPGPGPADHYQSLQYQQQQQQQQQQQPQHRSPSPTYAAEPMPTAATTTTGPGSRRESRSSYYEPSPSRGGGGGGGVADDADDEPRNRSRRQSTVNQDQSNYPPSRRVSNQAFDVAPQYSGDHLTRSSPIYESQQVQQTVYASRSSSQSRYGNHDDAVAASSAGGPEYHTGRRYSQQEMASMGLRRSPRVSQTSLDEDMRRVSLQHQPESSAAYDDGRTSAYRGGGGGGGGGSSNYYSNGSGGPASDGPAYGYQGGHYEYSQRSHAESARSVVAQHYEQTYEQVNQQLDAASHRAISRGQSFSPERPLPRRPKNRNSNILSAVLCLIKELDGPSLEVAEMAVRCRMEELED